jgi:hypothetical protein
MLSQLANIAGFGNNTHEIFNNHGKILVDTKKYKLYSINSKDIYNDKLQKPECQRLLDNDQVNRIYNYQIDHNNKHGEYFFTNPITLGLLEGKYYIIDGQHRLKCIEILNYTSKFEVLICLLILETQQELDDKYVAINQNKPVPLPENIEDWKQFGRHIEEYLSYNFSKYFSNTVKPFSPNFNKEKLMNYINDNNIGDKINHDYHRFITEIEELNTYYKNTYTVSMLPYFSNNISKQIEKSKSKQPNNPLFLSLYKNFEWVDRIIYKINNNIDYPNMKHVSCENRIKIKKKLRTEVWCKYFDDSRKGNCIVCVDEINYDNFQCGHIKSVFYGGETNLTNLDPICGRCNNDMGIMDLNIYKEQLDKQMN